MSAPPYQPGTPAPSSHPDPDPTRYLNAPPYPPPDQQPPGGPTLQSRTAGHPNAHQPDPGQSTISGGDRGNIQHGGSLNNSAHPSQLHATNESSASGYHAQGQVSNNLNIDPALLALGQGVGTPNSPQFHMHPGSQLNISGNAFQHRLGGNACQQNLITQGNQNLRLEGTEPAANDADKMEEGDRTFNGFTKDITDDTDSFFDKFLFNPTMAESGLDFPVSKFEFEPTVPASGFEFSRSKYGSDLTTPAFGPDSFHNKLGHTYGNMLPVPKPLELLAHHKPNDTQGLMLPPPLPSKALARNIGNNNYQVLTQRGGVYPSFSPDGPSHGFVNSSDDHSVGGTCAIQESSGDSRSSASPTKKRQRSSSDDSRSNASMEGSHKPQRPATQQRKRTRMSSSSVSTGATTSSESQASSHMSRREALLAADDSDIKVASRPLQGMSRDEAAEMYIKRVALDVTGDDNIDEVKAEPQKWLHAILQAFDAAYNNTPRTKNIGLQDFQEWQKEHHALTMEQFRQDQTNRIPEAIATHLYNLVVDGHERGSLIESSGKSFKHDGKLKCKNRLEKIIEALTGLTIIRYDLATGNRVHELVANPDAVFKRKEENKLENDRKRVKKEAADAAKEVDKKKSAVKAKNNKAAKADNKRGGQRKVLVAKGDDEESSSRSDDEGLEAGPENLRSSTRAASTSVPESRPVSHNDYNSAHDVSTPIAKPKRIHYNDLYPGIDEFSSGSDI